MIRKSLARSLDALRWKKMGAPVPLLLEELRSRQFDSKQMRQERQSKLLSELLLSARSEVPWYKDRISLGESDILSDPFSAIQKLPVLTREDLSKQFSNLKGMPRKGQYENSTGGSTGSPVRVLQDSCYYAHVKAQLLLTHEWMGLSSRVRHAKIWGAPRDAGFGHKLRDYVGNTLFLDAFLMSPSAMTSISRKLLRFRPQLLEGYASALYELARFANEQRLPLPSPVAIVSSASLLSEEMRKVIETSFSAPVFNRYGCREASILAMECEHRKGLHVSGETVLLEVVDNNLNPVQEGESGEVLVTSFHNLSMPLIRYRLGDRATWLGTQCSCGRPDPLILLDQGRSSACFPTLAGGVLVSEFFSVLFGVHHKERSVRKFQVIQESLDQLLVRVVLAPGKKAEFVSRQGQMARDIEKAMGGPCQIGFSLEEDISPSASGKHLDMISKVGASE